jgi:hypothetical protein
MPTMFLHYYNDSDVDIRAVLSSVTPDLSGSYHCYMDVLPANDETVIGPFDFVYAPTISITKTACEYSTDVTVAALYTNYMYPIEEVVLTTVSGVLNINPTTLAGVLPSAAISLNGE